MHRPHLSPQGWLVRLILAAWLCSALVARADELADVQRLYYSGQAAVAMDRADQYIATHPTDPQMRFLKGVMLAEQKRNPQAMAVFEKLTQDYPDIPEPYNNLAALYAATGDYDKARVTLEQALRTNPSYATASENLGDVYAALAAQSYDRALKFDPQNAEVPAKLALLRSLYKRPATEAPGAAASGPPSAASAPASETAAAK